MKKLLIVLCSFLSCYNSIAQEYKSYVLVNDTISESGDNIVHLNGDLYTMSLTACQPDAQSCAQLRKFDQNLNTQWTIYFPNTRKSNEHSINILNDSTLIIVGRNNSQNQQQAFYHHVVSTDGHILDFVEHTLPYESNIILGSRVHNNMLYMYGTSREFLSTPGIDVDALIITHDLNTGIDSLNYFDYDNNFYVDIYDLQNNSDSTLVFISRRRNFDYINERDYVIEEIQSDGTRKEFYNIKVPHETGITTAPSLEVLANGRLAFFKSDETNLGGSKTIRILDDTGVFLYDVIIWSQIWPDINTQYNITKTEDGGFIICGQYADRTMLTETSIEFNGMLLKVDNTGELSWIRQYRHEHNGTGEPTRSFLFDVKELPNGDIIATGNVENITNDLWVIKTNSEGCLGDDECGDMTVGIDESFIQTNYVNIYPNPVISGQNLQVEVSSQINGSVQYQLVGMQGRSNMHGFISRGQNSINTSQIPTGIYTLVIDLGKRGIERHKIIIN